MQLVTVPFHVFIGLPPLASILVNEALQLQVAPTAKTNADVKVPSSLAKVAGAPSLFVFEVKAPDIVSVFPFIKVIVLAAVLVVVKLFKVTVSKSKVQDEGMFNVLLVVVIVPLVYLKVPPAPYHILVPNVTFPAKVRLFVNADVDVEAKVPPVTIISSVPDITPEWLNPAHDIVSVVVLFHVCVLDSVILPEITQSPTNVLVFVPDSVTLLGKVLPPLVIVDVALIVIPLVPA